MWNHQKLHFLQSQISIKKNQNCKLESVQTSKGFTTTTTVPLRSTNELEPWYHNSKSGALLMEFSWEFLLRFPPLSTWTYSLPPHCHLAQASSAPSTYSPRLPVTSLYAPPPSPTGRLPVLLPQLGFLFLPTLPLTWASTLPYPWVSSTPPLPPSAKLSVPSLPSPFTLTKVSSLLSLLTQTSSPFFLCTLTPFQLPSPHPHQGFMIKWIDLLRWDSKTFKKWNYDLLWLLWLWCVIWSVQRRIVCSSRLVRTAKQKSLQEINQWKQRWKDPQKQFRKWQASWWWNGIVSFLQNQDLSTSYWK